MIILFRVVYYGVKITEESLMGFSPYLRVLPSAILEK
jgi:hypothetical protein